MNYLQNIEITAYTSTLGLTKDEAKLHLNILDTSFDDLIDDYLTSAHVMLYQETSILIDGTLKGYLSTLEDFKIPLGGVASIAIYYYDSANDKVLLDDSNYILNDGVISSVEIIGSVPSVYDRDFAFEVEVTTAANTNPMVTQVLRMMVADFFENRQTNAIGASVNRVISRPTEWQISLISRRLTI